MYESESDIEVADFDATVALYYSALTPDHVQGIVIDILTLCESGSTQSANVLQTLYLRKVSILNSFLYERYLIFY